MNILEMTPEELDEVTRLVYMKKLNELITQMAEVKKDQREFSEQHLERLSERDAERRRSESREREEQPDNKIQKSDTTTRGRGGRGRGGGNN